MVLFIDAFVQTAKVSLNKYENYLAPISMDVLFLILYGAIMGGVFKKAMFYLIQAGYSAISLYQSEITESTSLIGLILEYSETRLLLAKIVFLLFMTVVLIFFVYGFTQGFAWSKSRRILSNVKTRHYLHLFFRVNLFWFSIFILYKFILVLVRVSETLAKIQSRPIGEYVFMFAFLYFVFLSYCFIKEDSRTAGILRKTLKTGIFKCHKLIPIYLVFILGLVIIHYILIYLSSISTLISLITSIILLLPALTFGRLYLLAGVGQLEE